MSFVEDSAMPVVPASSAPFEDLTTIIEDRSRCPIKDMPNEILHLIFVAMKMETTLDMQFGPCGLEQVCLKWKMVVSTSPQLWENVVVDVTDLELRSLERRRAQLATIFSRSKGRPINLSFTRTVDNTPGSYPAVLDTILCVVAEQSHRFKTLALNLPRHLLHVMDPHFRPFTILKELSLLAYDPDDSERQVLRAFRTALQLNAVSINFDSADLDIQWSQIIALESLRGELDDFNVLQEASSLVHYTHTSEPTTLPPGNPFVRLNNLRTITLHGFPCEGPQLILPNLDQATFDFDTTMNYPLTEVRELIYRSKCNVRSLTVTGKFALGDDLLSIIELSPGLVELSIITWRYGSPELSEVEFVDGLMKELTNTPDRDRCLAPSLKYFACNLAATEFRIDWDLTRGMWESRQKDLDDTKQNSHRVARLLNSFVADVSHRMKDGVLSESPSCDGET